MRNIQIEMRLPDIRKPLHGNIRHEGRAVAQREASDPARKVGNLPREFEIGVVKVRCHSRRRGCEPGDVVARNPRIPHRSVDAHPPDEIPVLVPGVAHERNVGNMDGGVAREDFGVLEPEAALRHVETAREAFQFKKPLRSRAESRSIEGYRSPARRW